MKKTIAILLSILLLMSLAACSGQKEKTPDGDTGKQDSDITVTDPAPEGQDLSPLSQLVADGLEEQMLLIYEDNVLRCLFTNEDRTVFKLALTPMTQEQRTAYDELDIFDDDYDQKKSDLYDSLTGTEIRDLTNLIPDEAQCQALVGKTVKELIEENDASWSPFITSPDMIEIFLSVGFVSYEVELTDIPPFEDSDDCTDEMIEAMKIKTATFYTLADSVMTAE